MEAPVNDVARAAYERHMKRILPPTAVWARTALGSGALRPVAIEDVRLFTVPNHARMRAAGIEKPEETHCGKLRARGIAYVSHTWSDTGQP
jgi:hypothetical protein